MMKTKNHKIILGITALLMFAAGCSPKPGTLQVVRKDKIKRGDIYVTISSTGEVKPQNRVEIKPPMAGRVDHVLVVEGQEVKEGDILAWMSSTDRAALLDVARSQGPENVKRWEDAYKAAPLIAPLDGTVILRAAEPGQTVTSVDPIVVLADRLIVEAVVDETDLSLVKLGQKVEIRLDAYPGEKLPAKVDHLAYESRLVNNVSMYPVDILPEKVPATFRSGMTATVTFIVTERNQVLLIPAEAVNDWPRNLPRPDASTFAVYQKKFGGKLVPVPVHTGATDGRMTEIIDGLKEGDEVMIVQRRQGDKKKNPFSMQPQQQRRPQGNARG